MSTTLTKKQREEQLDELVALQESLPEWNAEEIVYFACKSGDIPLRLESPKPEEYAYSEAEYRRDKETKRRHKQKLKIMPWIWATALALVSGLACYSVIEFRPYSFAIAIVALILGGIIGSFHQKATWERANSTRYNKLNKYEKELFAYVYWSRRRGLDFWRSLSGSAFEHELAKLFRLAGYRADVTPPSGDKGVDIVLVKDGRKGIVQCKAHTAQIGPNIVRELYGAATHFDSDFAILASVSGFTKGAIQFADEKGIRLIRLEDIIGMQESIAQSGIPRTTTSEDESSIASECASDQELLDDPQRFFSFGQMAFDGDGMEQDYVAAANWFRIAAERGNAKAQHNLALMYENGEGVPQDYSEAAKWYGIAAAQGNPGSQNNLGSLYETGDGVTQDYAAAIEWYSRAVEGGDTIAPSNLQRVTARVELEQFQEIVFAFIDLMAAHSPLIGDCALLPHPKATILYAIKFVVDDYETKRELATDPALVESYDRMIPTLNCLFTCLARDWHDIAPEDKDVIAKLTGYDSFPEWALPLEQKYIDDERASMEAADAAFRVLKDKVDREKAHED